MRKSKLRVRLILSYWLLRQKFKHLRGIILIKGKDDCITLNKNYLVQVRYCWSNNKHVNVSCIETEGVYMRADLVQAACISNSEKKWKQTTQNQEETTDIDNQDPLKAWTLFLTEKENNVRKKKLYNKPIWDKIANNQDLERIPKNPWECLILTGKRMIASKILWALHTTATSLTSVHTRAVRE